MAGTAYDVVFIVRGPAMRINMSSQDDHNARLPATVRPSGTPTESATPRRSAVDLAPLVERWSRSLPRPICTAALSTRVRFFPERVAKMTIMTIRASRITPRPAATNVAWIGHETSPLARPAISSTGCDGGAGRPGRPELHGL